MQKFLLAIFLFCSLALSAQFAPPVGVIGTSAMHKDSSAFINWASICTVTRGYKDISVPDSGFASVGDSSMALGHSGSNGVVSLGDGGYAILQFPYPIKDMAGPDFAVFENSFSDNYLELAFVEVSSDGINFFRFNAASNTQDTLQIGPFDLLDATKLNNLAGKYRMFYGTPFDLNELSGISGLDINNITHVKIVDVVGSVHPLYASNDSNGHKVNDPWPTPFASCGFDLDAVGVIHQNTQVGIAEATNDNNFMVFQPDEQQLHFVLKNEKISSLKLYDLNGKIIAERKEAFCPAISLELNAQTKPGLYICELKDEAGSFYTKKIIIK